MDEPLMTTAEACAVLRVDPEQAALLMAGPLAPDAGLLTLRQALGCAVIYALPALRGPDAVAIALAASREARMDGEPRLLAIGWRRGETIPVACWFRSDIPADLTTTMIVVPADHMLAELNEAVTTHRAMTARPN